MPFGFVDILTVLLVTVGPLKALIVFGTLTATAEPAFRRSGPGRKSAGHRASVHRRVAPGV
jgi:hypothetical protein